MSIDPDLRIALGFILLLRFGIGVFYMGLSPEIGILVELRRCFAERKWPARLVWALLVAPMIPFLWDAQGIAVALYPLNNTLAAYSIMWLPDVLRWQMLVPAVAALLLLIWTFHCAIRPAELDSERSSASRFITGPFRVLRFPQWLADLILFAALLVATDNWFAVFSYFAACFALHKLYLPQAELAWKRLLGSDYEDYASRTGPVLPKMPASNVQGPVTSYAVPKRFGMSAIIALVTLFAVIFGGLNLLQSRITEFRLTPMLHIFFGLQLMVTWIAQMRFGQTPRRVSAFVGAVLLPTFVLLTFDLRPSHQLTLLTVALFFFGGLLGYCLGAIVAGLFLFMDWLGPHIPGARGSG